MKTSIHLETQNRQSALHQQLCGICMAKDVSSIGKLETESKLGRLKHMLNTKGLITANRLSLATMTEARDV